jgi:hypothetical protein
MYLLVIVCMIEFRKTNWKADFIVKAEGHDWTSVVEEVPFGES